MPSHAIAAETVAEEVQREQIVDASTEDEASDKDQVDELTGQGGSQPAGQVEAEREVPDITLPIKKVAEWLQKTGDWVRLKRHINELSRLVIKPTDEQTEAIAEIAIRIEPAIVAAYQREHIVRDRADRVKRYAPRVRELAGEKQIKSTTWLAARKVEKLPPMFSLMHRVWFGDTLSNGVKTTGDLEIDGLKLAALDHIETGLIDEHLTKADLFLLWMSIRFAEAGIETIEGHQKAIDAVFAALPEQELRRFKPIKTDVIPYPLYSPPIIADASDDPLSANYKSATERVATGPFAGRDTDLFPSGEFPRPAVGKLAEDEYINGQPLRLAYRPPADQMIARLLNLGLSPKSLETYARKVEVIYRLDDETKKKLKDGNRQAFAFVTSGGMKDEFGRRVYEHDAEMLIRQIDAEHAWKQVVVTTLPVLAKDAKTLEALLGPEAFRIKVAGLRDEENRE